MLDWLIALWPLYAIRMFSFSGFSAFDSYPEYIAWRFVLHASFTHSFQGKRISVLISRRHRKTNTDVIARNIRYHT